MQNHENKFVIAEIESFRFRLNLPKDFDKNLKHEVVRIVRHHVVLAKQKVKNEIDQILFKYKHENNIQKYRKQQNQ